MKVKSIGCWTLFWMAVFFLLMHGIIAPTANGKDDRLKEKDERYVNIDFDNVDILVFIKLISESTGKNFVIDKSVRGNVTIISPRKITVDEAYQVFESVLDVHGYAAIPAGDIIKIVPSRDAKEKNVETLLREEALSSDDRIVTQIISLNYANPEELRKMLTPLVSKSSVILAYPPTGMLVITDLLSNIERLLKIIDALDVEGIAEQITVIPLEYASASGLIKSLNVIFQEGNAQRRRSSLDSPIKIVADERTNTIIILASENDTLRIKELIRLLDKDVPRSEEKMRAYRLQNADAEELTKVLMNLPSKDSGTAEAGKTPVLSKDVQVVPDKATNTLIIMADRDDYLVLEDVIKKLDIPRPMVYIEALIMEVNVDREFNLGVEWMGGEDFTVNGRQNVYGGGFTGAGLMKTEGLPLPSGFSVGVFGESITIGRLVFPSLGAIFQAYQKDQDVHILSTPQILTLDNEEAEIYVGENIPYLSKSASGDQNYETYEYKDIGITLRITPQISQERFVRLNIFQEVTKMVQESTTSYKPTTLKRTTKTVVSIKDKNTIVVGGLIGDDITNTTYGVPCIVDIPFVGNLFKYKSENREKRNLFVFITPHIIETSVEAKQVYEEKQKHINAVEEGVIKTYKRRQEK